MLYCDSRCSQTLIDLPLALPGAVLCNATRRLGDRQRVILRQRVRGSVRAVRAVRNTRVFQTETRVVADDTLSFPTIGFPLSFEDFVDPQNYMDPHSRVVSYLLTFFLHFSIQNCSPSHILFACCEKCGGILMVGSLPSSSVVSPQQPPSNASLGSLNEHLQVLLQLCSTTIRGQSYHMYMYSDI